MKKLFTLFFALIFSVNSFSSEQVNSLSVLTYNLGLAHTFVPLAEERLPKIIEALKTEKADVMCFQEVWNKSDRKELVKSLKKEFPFSFLTKIKNVKSEALPTCKISEIFGEGKFVACMQNNCSGKEGDEFTDCIINTCGPALRSLKEENRECATSLMAQVGKSSLMAMLTILNPFKRAGLYAYKGSNGLVMMSKYPLKNTHFYDLTKMSTLNRRGALVADVDVNGKTIKVACAHIAADLEKTVPYTGVFKSWVEENTVQFKTLLDDIGSSTSPAILLGDFNCSIKNEAAGIEGEAESSCRQIFSSKFSAPAMEDHPECTYCKSNTLTDEDDHDVLIDHIFLKDLTMESSEVVYKELVTLKIKGEGEVESNLSDHFGVRMTIPLK